MCEQSIAIKINKMDFMKKTKNALTATSSHASATTGTATTTKSEDHYHKEEKDELDFGDVDKTVIMEDD